MNLTIIKEANKYKGNLKKCYEMGYDSAINGVNTKNCHFSLFASPEMTKAWENGNKEGLTQKENK